MSDQTSNDSNIDTQDGPSGDWYLLDCHWLTRYQEYIESDGPHPGRITNERLLNLDEELIKITEPTFNGFLNRNLKDGLKEDADFKILPPAMWTYLERLYGGIAIRRFSVQNGTESAIEINLQKLYVFEVP